MKNPIITVLDRLNLLVLANDTYKRLKYWTNPALQKKNADFLAVGAPDKLPLPSPELVFLVTSHFDVKAYYESGNQDAEAIRNALQKNNIDINNLSAILDFGCGCGRTIRNFKDLTNTKIYGCDYNPKLIDWSKKNLTFAQFSVNGLNKKLDYEDNQVELIYAISVFTHLSEDLQNFWLEELNRISKPGGLLYISLQGTTRLPIMTEEEKNKFNDGQIVMRYDRAEGSNVCGAFHPEAYIRREWTKKGFTVVDFIPAGAKGSNQDVVLLRKD